MDYLDWKNEFEKNVQMINANRFLETGTFFFNIEHPLKISTNINRTKVGLNL